MAYAPKRRLSAEESAARVFAVFSKHLDKVMSIETLMTWTSLTRSQALRGERHLKEFLNEHVDEAEGWTLFVNIGPDSMHGLVKDDDGALLNALSRLRYMSSRAASELDYHGQQVARVQDPIIRKHLRRGDTFQRAATEAFAEAYERLAQA